MVAKNRKSIKTDPPQSKTKKLDKEVAKSLREQWKWHLRFPKEETGPELLN